MVTVAKVWIARRLATRSITDLEAREHGNGDPVLILLFELHHELCETGFTLASRQTLPLKSHLPQINSPIGFSQ